MRPVVAILLHRQDTTFRSIRYLVHPLMQAWTALGLEVRVVRGPAAGLDADVILPHVDLTVMPEAYRSAWPPDRPVINRRVLDISKSRISAELLGRGDAHAGPVIVKTDRNFGGLPERRLGLSRSLMARVGRVLRRGLGPARQPAWRDVDHLDPARYAVFESLAAVPGEVFGNPHLVVERFAAEREGDAYVLRYTYCLGDRETSIAMWSRERVVRGESADRIEAVPTPPEIGALRARFGLDYGKLDYVLRDGRVVLLDLNRTPGFVTLDLAGLTRGAVAHLAPGLTALLARGGQSVSSR